jgi:hypothetical protein
MRHNPVYPKAWEPYEFKFNIGDRVKVVSPMFKAPAYDPIRHFEGKKGEVVKRSKREESSAKYFVKFDDGPPVIDFYDDEIKHDKSFARNPVYDKTWDKPHDGKFQIGETVQVRPETIGLLNVGVEGDVVGVVHNIGKRDNQIAYTLFFRSPVRTKYGTPIRYTWFYEHELGKPGSFTDNPVHSKQWYVPKFKKGDKVRVKKRGVGFVESNAHVFHSMPPIWQGHKIVYIVKFKDRKKTVNEKDMTPVYENNPVYDKTWGNLKFKKGGRVVATKEAIVNVRPQVVVEKGSTGTFVEWKPKHDLEAAEYYVRWDQFPSFVYMMLENEIRPYYGENPVYDKEWHPAKFKKGDRVQVRPETVALSGLKGPVKGKVNTVGEGADNQPVYLVRYDIPQYSDRFGKYFEFELGKPGSFKDNPVYDKTWGFRKFKKGDRARTVKPFMYPGSRGRDLTMPARTRGTVGTVSSDGESVIFTPDEYPRTVFSLTVDWLEKDKYIDNPVYPKKWYKMDFKEGDTVLVRRGSHTGYGNERYRAHTFGTIKKARPIKDGGYYMVDFLKPYIRDSGDSIGYSWFSDEELMLFRGYAPNPVYPKRWHEPPFKIGERIKLKHGTRVYPPDGAVALPAGSTATVRRIYNFPKSGYTSLDITFDAIPKHEFGMAGELFEKTGFNNNPVYPKQWGKEAKLVKGEKVKVVRGGYRGETGHVSQILDDFYFVWVRTGRHGPQQFPFLREELESIA